MFKPARGYVLVSYVEKETPAGIILPDSVDKRAGQLAIVKAVGDPRITDEGVEIPVPVVPGDKVIIAKFTGHEVEIEGKVYLLLEDRYILAVDKK